MEYETYMCSLWSKKLRKVPLSHQGTLNLEEKSYTELASSQDYDQPWLICYKPVYITSPARLLVKLLSFSVFMLQILLHC